MYVYKYDYRLLGAKLLYERVCPSVNHSETHSVTVILPNISKNNVRRTYCTKNKICMLILSMSTLRLCIVIRVSPIPDATCQKIPSPDF